jgi:hypothetical protein
MDQDLFLPFRTAPPLGRRIAQPLVGKKPQILWERQQESQTRIDWDNHYFRIREKKARGREEDWVWWHLPVIAAPSYINLAPSQKKHKIKKKKNRKGRKKSKLSTKA